MDVSGHSPSILRSGDLSGCAGIDPVDAKKAVTCRSSPPARSRSPKKVEVKGNSKDKAKSTPEIEQVRPFAPAERRVL